MSADLVTGTPASEDPVCAEWKGAQQLTGLKMETYKKKSNKCGTGRPQPVAEPRVCSFQLPTFREYGFSMSTEQLLAFFLAIWFFYFFYLQD